MSLVMYNQGPQILIVENDQETIKRYKELLDSACKLQIVPSTDEALTILQSQSNFDVVLLDHRFTDPAFLQLLSETLPFVRVVYSIDADYCSSSGKATDYRVYDCHMNPFRQKELPNNINFCVKDMPRAAERQFSEDTAKSKKKQTRLSAKTVSKITRAIKFIDANFAAKINLSLAASKAGMSKFHFSRMFKKGTGTNYQDYLSSRRVEKAKELLKITSLSVSETALSVGYKDITHFERIFKAIVGVTPSSYKKTTKQPIKDRKEQYWPSKE